MEKEGIFPYVFKLKTPTQKDIVENFSKISEEIESLNRLRLDIVYKEFRFKSIGSQKLPVSLTCRTKEEFLCFIDKESQMARYEARYDLATKEFLEFKNLNLTCRRVFMVENEITALCFPDIKESIVIFAQGYGVGVFRDVKWLKQREIYYWCDIDMDGFAILSQARRYFPQIKSLFMDIETLEEFKELGVKSSLKIYKKLDNLTKEEMIVYDRLFNDYYGENFRLEQERLAVLNRLREKTDE